VIRQQFVSTLQAKGIPQEKIDCAANAIETQLGWQVMNGQLTPAQNATLDAILTGCGLTRTGT
jgi:hypothetical protein